MKRVLLVQPSLNPPGGGNAVAAWMIEGLRETCRVEALTWEPIDFDWINRHCGTSLRASDLMAHAIPPLLARLTPSRGFQLWKHNQLAQIARRIGADCDAIIGANCEADLGPRGIQYVHFPRYADPRLRGERFSRDPGALKWYHRSPTLMRTYFHACAIGTGYSHGRMRESLTLVNSDWTGSRYRETHGGNPRTLYPPVSDRFPDVPWAQREMGFVCIGRISPEKRVEMIIEVLATLRQRGHDVHLHVVGTPGHDLDYVATIRRLVAHYGDWAALELDLDRSALSEIIARHRFGIHGMRDEHFGIAVGEMVNAGCIVFAPGSGGQAEIIGDYADLRYFTVEEAVSRIDAMLAQPSRQDAARAHLANRRARFSTTRFMREVQSIVEELGKN